MTVWTKEERKMFSKAARIMERRGMCKHQVYLGSDPRKGPVCLLGAINAATDSNGAMWRYDGTDANAYRERLKAILRMDPADWNNEQKRRKRDVVGFLKRLAKGVTS